MVYRKYSDYLRETYGESVYKLPINLPVTCPNRDGTKGTGGCVFCAGAGAGFEAQSAALSVTEQLQKNRAYMGAKYHAKKFIAYFQNYSNTYMPVPQFREYMMQALEADIVELAVATRPDCIEDGHLAVLREVQARGVRVTVELGLQSANDRTLTIIRRGHTVADFCEAVRRCHAANLSVCAHLIANLPWDSRADVIAAAELCNRLKIESVKLHSLYVVRDTVLGEWYESGAVQMIPYAEYVERTIAFLEHLAPETVVQRLLGRAPEPLTLFENYGHSWRKIHDEIVAEMEKRHSFQGMAYSKNETQR